jgi:hypothetical protein
MSKPSKTLPFRPVYVALSLMCHLVVPAFLAQFFSVEMYLLGLGLLSFAMILFSMNKMGGLTMFTAAGTAAMTAGFLHATEPVLSAVAGVLATGMAGVFWYHAIPRKDN